MRGCLFGKNDSLNLTLTRVIRRGNYPTFLKNTFGVAGSPPGHRIQHSSAVIEYHRYPMTLAERLRENKSLLGAHLLAYP